MKPVQTVTAPQLMALILQRQTPIQGITVHMADMDYTTLPQTAAAHVAPVESPVEAPATKELPDRIDVIRFYRPRDENGKIVSNLGLTVLYELDYKNRHIIAFFAICKGENFSKELGRKTVLERQQLRMGIKFPLPLERGPDLVEQMYKSIRVMETIHEATWQRRVLNTAYVNVLDHAKIRNHVEAVRSFLLEHLTAGVA